MIRPFDQPCDGSLITWILMLLNIHPLPNTICEGQSYDMGEFMSKQLKLRALRDFALETYKRPKPLNYDEDNVATQYKEVEGWTVHRKRAWMSLFSGAHYDMIDFLLCRILRRAHRHPGKASGNGWGIWRGLCIQSIW